jgi:hypothetical protein
LRRLATATALAIVLALGTFGYVRAQVVPGCPSNELHTYVEGTTNSAGFVDLNLPCQLPANSVVQLGSGATHLGGENPSFATVNFGGFVDGDTIHARVIGWHAIASGQAEFRYYSNKNARVSIDAHPPTVLAS